MLSSFFEYFTDPVLRAPTMGSMLMCFAAAIVGVIVFLRKQSLVGESLSHAAYPGVITGVIIAGVLNISDDNEQAINLLIMGGAFCTALAGYGLINLLQNRLKVRSDSALCFVLSAFFGLGIALASDVQFTYSSLYRQVSIYLMGQAATMRDVHVLIYGLLSLLVTVGVIALYKELQTISFDRDYAKSLGMKTKQIDFIVFILIVLAVVIGIRSVGVVLMSAMLIAPAAAARQYTNKLYLMFIIAALFGLLSGFLGNYLSVEISNYMTNRYATRMALPTGPMIVLVASAICVLSLMFAPQRGLVLRIIRIARFRYQCICENLLKAMWRIGPGEVIPFDEIAKYQSVSPLYLQFVLLRLAKNGWIEKVGDQGYRLNSEGKIWAARIVRIHRLWEVYLVDYLGVGAEKVHRSAEEMEHIITPDLERELTQLLKNPVMDPHHRPIPPKEV